MSKLTKTIQECGLHCGCEQGEQFFISEKEAIAIREKVKQACIEAVKQSTIKYMPDAESRAIKAIQEVE